MSNIHLPDGYHLDMHTADFTTELPHSIVGVMQGQARAEYIHSLSAREARLVHQKVHFTLQPDSLVFELGLASQHARAIIMNTLDVDATFGEFCRSNWDHVYTLSPVEGLKNTDLYRSSEDIIEHEGKKWKIKFWFCGPNVNCGIHNEHDFVEWHVGVAGDGRMEKFTDFDESTLIESWRMSPGQAHPIFAYDSKKDEKGNPVYPPHRWFGGNTGDLWMVIEEFF